MTKRCLVLVCTMLSLVCAAQTDSVISRIFLIGDAGELHNGKHEVVDWLSQHVEWKDSFNTVIFLGDNVYPYGMPMKSKSAEYQQAKAIVDYQVSLIKGKPGRTFFIPGNHDWMNGKMGGWQQVMNETNYINSLDLKNVIAEPRDGCPGPVAYDLNDKVVLVMMDSQWFMHIHDKPGPGSNCDSKTIDEFVIQLRGIAAAHPKQLLVMAMHHPLYSFGVHGGKNFGLKEYIFPLTALSPSLYIPLPIGFVYPLVRSVFGNLQDLKHPLYRNMAAAVEDALSGHPNHIAVAGHDHSLQFITKDSLAYIVSGAGSNISKVEDGTYKPDTGESRVKTDAAKSSIFDSKKEKLVFSDLTFGFAMLEVRKSGRVETKYYDINSTDLAHPKFSQQLKSIDTLPTIISKDSIPLLPDTYTVAGNSELHAGGIKRMLMGKNYREEWTTPVTAKVLDISKEMGGLTPDKQGGGKQTISLRLKDSTGKEWALRSIKKYPDAAIPADLRSPFVADVVKDGVSASYPYASLSVGPIAHAAGVPTLKGKLFYVPDDPRFGRFRQIYKQDSSRLAVLEERVPEGVKKADNTDELVLKLAKDNDNHVDQREVLKARLVDNFIMDFDRHEDQWQWATRDTGKGKIYYPIPRDHDQAFFVNQGLLPKFARKPWFVPELQGFRAKTFDINTFNRPARNFDRFFLTELNKEQWQRQIDTFLKAMTDSVIETAIMQQPREIRGYHGDKIISTLKNRRNYFEKDMLQYYRYISKEVNIVGSNKKELFTVNKLANGFVQVTINKLTEEKGKISSLIYDRTFDPAETKELRLYGLDDNDSFVVKGGATPIKVRIVGGSGDDHFINEGSNSKVLVYDVNFENNVFGGEEKGFSKRLSNDPQANMYNRLYYKLSYVKPSVSAAYNIDDGLYLGAYLELLTQGFRKEPYNMRHQLIANRSVLTSSYHFRYEGDFTKVFANTDLLIRSDVRAPINVTNFFGIGNNTEFDKSNPKGIRYYRARYDIINASVQLSQQLQSWMNVHYGLAFQYFNLNESQNVGKFLTNTAQSGLNPVNLYKGKMYAGAEVGATINNKNNNFIPTRGTEMHATLRPLFALNGVSKNVTQFDADIRIFASLHTKGKLVYVERFGGGRNFGKYEFQQAQYLSGTENLRGYRKDRFAGRSMIYNNFEVRYKFKDFYTYFFPGSIGLFVFNDVGRVWADGENSGRWHMGNGGGIWVAPIKRVVITAALTHSIEEKLMPYVTFGFQF